MALLSASRVETSSHVEDRDWRFGSDIAKWVMLAAAVTLLMCASLGSYYAKSWQIVHDAPLLHYVVFLMDHGRAPYRDIVEMNMPGAYMAEWLIIHTLGGDAFGWWLADLLMGIAGVAASAWIAGRQRRAAGVAAGALTYLYHLSNGPADTGQRDWMVAVLLLIGFGLLFETIRSGRAIWMTGFMACCGMAASIKPPAIAIGLFFFLVVGWMFWREEGSAKNQWHGVIIYSLMGLILPGALTFGFLLHWGVTKEFIYDLHTLVPWYAGLAHVPLSVSLKNAVTMRPFLLGALIAFALNRSWQRWESLFLLGGALWGFALYLVQGKGWLYHLYAEVAFAALWGMLELSAALRGRKWMPVFAAAILGLTIASWAARTRVIKSREYPLVTLTHLQKDLTDLGGARLSGKVQCLDVTLGSCINVLYRMRLIQSTGFIYDTYLFPERETPFTASLQERFLHEITAKPPEVIVLSSHAWPQQENSYTTLDRFPAFEQILAQHYEVAKEFPMQPNSSGYRIYLAKQKGSS